MLRLAPSTRFRRDVKRIQRRGKNMDKLKDLVDLLATEQPLPAFYKVHPLKGSWKPHWDAHIETDWLLIYLADDGVLFLEAT
ncbi:MAG: type II toxin-antitoxin system YafQ family toxin [Deltaproteobacteria bacterium]|jgi:mRNA interferase YafQ|nr:type II toxin-antitoxin system YafQ family toxin [Deltaproteobacteria bacterium]